MFSKNYESIIEDIKFDNYNFEDYNFEDYMNKNDFISKDVCDGDIIKVSNISNCINGIFSLICENGIEIPCHLKKERKFFERHNITFNTIDELSDWLNSDECKQWFNENEIFISIEQTPYKINGSLTNAYNQEVRKELFQQIKNSTNIYECTILERNHGGFIVDIKGITAFMPGSLASANKIIDFNTFIGNKVNVMVEDYLKEGETFIVSNKKYISKILPDVISKLDITKKYTGEITGTKKFGIFVEFEEIVTSLLHLSEMTQETIDKFNEGYFKPGMKIDFYIKEILNNKIILTEIEGNIIKEVTMSDFKNDNEKKVRKGKITSIQPYGCFLNFYYKNKNFSGLYHIKQYSKTFVPELNDIISVYIDNVSVDDNKIHLKNPIY